MAFFSEKYDNLMFANHDHYVEQKKKKLCNTISERPWSGSLGRSTVAERADFDTSLLCDLVKLNL